MGWLAFAAVLVVMGILARGQSAKQLLWLGAGISFVVFLFATGEPAAGSIKAAPARNLIDVTITSDPTGALVKIPSYGQGRTPFKVGVPALTPVTYTVTPDEPYADYRLYKPFTGVLNVSEPQNVSVWIERTTAEEQAAQRQAAEERRRAEEERRRAEAERRQRELEAQRVYYRIATNCSRGVDITFANANGDTTQQSNQGNGWYYGMIPRSGQFLYISAQNQCSSGYVTVKLVKNGVTIRENTSSGGYTIASISGRW